MTNLPMRYLLLLKSLIKSWSYSLVDGAMTKLETGWINEIHKSRLVILPGEDSFLQGINVPVWKLIEQLANGVTEAELRQAHPCLTQADIRACSLFVYLRIIGKL
jgi:hypothetical protein